MYSDVRLVIWDLDETFWDGTLCEGGIHYRQRHHDIVISLCERGIMSSICSKNDFEPVHRILMEKGIWDYFIFPSINWNPKADRIAQIIEAAQLRSETVLFIDDNAGNRAHVQAAIPGIQIADQPDIEALLADPALVGKPDASLSRLKHYKVLEERHSAMYSVGGNNTDFLRQSNIVIDIIHTVEDHLDRAVELINRTNQLNFTKRRLPDDIDEAKRQLLEQISLHHSKVGLVSVRDRYGDYGICGFFLVQGLDVWANTKTIHFVFSCRCLGMGVEQWVYDLIGWPPIDIVGEVVSDLATKVDWINVPRKEIASTGTPSTKFREVRLRGGCELEVIAHYFKAQSASFAAELVTPHGSFNKPTHNSTVLSRSIVGLTESELRLLKLLRIDPSHFETQFFAPCQPGTLLIYSPTTDAILTIFRHRKTGFELPTFTRNYLDPGNAARTKAEAEEFNRIAGVVKKHYEIVPFDDLQKHAARYKIILDQVPAQALLVVILPNYLQNVNGTQQLLERQATLNEVFKVVGKDRPNVRFVEMTSLLETIDDVVAEYHAHFRRAVYRRLYQSIEQHYLTWMDAIAKGAHPVQSDAQDPRQLTELSLEHA